MFSKTKQHEQKLKEIGQLADQFAKTADEYDKSNLFTRQHVDTLIDSGYTTLTLPKKFEGQGANLYEMLLMQERLAQGSGSTALAIGWHLGIVYDLNEQNDWDSSVFKMVMQEIGKGKLINSASSEAATGSPTRGGKPETTATPTKNGWRLNGRKIFTTLAPALDYFLVTASIEDSEDIGQFLVPREVDGLVIEETWDSLAMRSTGSHDLLLENAEIPNNYLLTTVQRSMKVNGWLLHIPACYLGIALAAHKYAVQFAASYTPNSLPHPISELPNIQRLIGEAELELMTARHFLYAVADKWDSTSDKQSLVAELAAVKHHATNNAISVVDKAMRVVGARSLSMNNPMQRYYRDVRAGLHNPPMDDATIALLAKNAINREK